MQVDYIIVGFGLAGLALAEVLEQNQKSFVVFDDCSQRASLVAASVYNPVILKRFTPVWDVQEQLQIALPFYRQLEAKLNKSYDEQLPIYRIFNSIEEQNNWFAACDKPVLGDYLHPEILKNSNAAVNAPFGLGKVHATGKLRTKQLLADYSEQLSKTQKYRQETFDYEQLKLHEDGVSYNEIHAKKVVFCDGFGLKKNPYFKELPLNGTKGELITIHTPELQLDAILKASVFILPMGNDHYKVGATFNRDDKTPDPTPDGKQELIRKLESVIKVAYTIVKHEAGIRPTTRDRRPLLGSHAQHQQLAVLNGLGTRGVLLAPKMAKCLFEYLEKGSELPAAVSITRFA